ncbi:MAG TPA: vWA domain-containing protein [Polyangiales bacterium]|nr:vWA domain-containing protein [Polyangiales bacterium]
MRLATLFVLGLGLAASATHVLAQARPPAPAGTAIEDLLPLANDPNDPIGLERDDKTLDRAGPAQPTAAAANSGNGADDARRFGPVPPLLAAHPGEVLTAIEAVRETAHRVSVELTAGLALVHTELVLESSAEKPAEAELRLAVPDDAALGALAVCQAKACRDGVVDSAASGELDAYDDALQARGPVPIDSALPLARAFLVHDERGAAIVVRAAPITKSRALTVRLGYVTSAAQHGGRVHVLLPARGSDPRIAPSQVTLHAAGLVDPTIARTPLTAQVTVDPSEPIEISARAAGDSSTLLRFACGAKQCLYGYASAAPQSARAVDLVLAIDVSPSMEGPARSRMLSGLAVILEALPAGSTVRALVFAGQASALIAKPQTPDAVSMSTFAPAGLEAELGSATRFEAAYSQIERWGWSKSARRKLVVIVGDGGLTIGSARPFAAAANDGVEVSALNLADRGAVKALVRGVMQTGGVVVDAGAEAQAAMRGGDAERLKERVSALFARSVAPNLALVPRLRAGDSWSLDTLVAGHRSAGGATRAKPELAALLAARFAKAQGAPLGFVAVDPRDLVHVRNDRPAGQDRVADKHSTCDRRGPALRHGGLSFDLAPVSLARERARCALPVPKAKAAGDDDSGKQVGAGMPGSPLLSMLRQRIIPVARGCFRRDRAGRADYQVRAVFEFHLAEREVVSAEITGKIADELRSCLLASVDTLLVPRFTGVVIVRYPLVTEREALPAQIELTPQAEGQVDAVIAAQKTASH